MVKFIDLEHLVSEKTEDDRPVRPKSKPGEMATHFRQMETDPDLDLPDLAVAVTDKNDLYTEGLRYVTQVFAAIRKRKKFALDPGFRIIRRIVQSRSTQRSLFIRAIHQDDTRAYLAQKSVNVSLFSIRMADMLGYDSDQQVEIGMAGLLHEIGMALIPEKVLFKGGPLSGQELEVVRQHSEFGYQILKFTAASTLTWRRWHCRFMSGSMGPAIPGDSAVMRSTNTLKSSGLWIHTKRSAIRAPTEADSTIFTPSKKSSEPLKCAFKGNI